MPFPFAWLVLASLALAGAQDAAQADAERERLAANYRDLLGQIDDPAWMADWPRAAIVRSAVEANWKRCAAIEAAALARRSEAAARALAEAALVTCRPWERTLRRALDKGAYPYRAGPGLTGVPSRDDMVEHAGLEARDAAIERILLWRGTSPRAGDALAATAPPRNPGARIDPPPAPPLPLPQPAPIPTTAPEAAPSEEAAILVVGRPHGGCRVRFADRTLTEPQLAQKAREWAAAGTRLRLVRPAGADYRCLARIVWHLGEYGLRLFEFADAPDPAAPR